MAIYLNDIIVGKPGHLGGGSWEFTALNQLTVIFGKNGSGKSQLLRGIAASKEGTYHYTFPERTGDIVSDMSLVQDQLHNPRGTNTAANPSKNLSSSFRQNAVSRLHVLLLKMSGKPGGSALGSAKEDIQEFLGELLPDFQLKIIAGKQNNIEITRIVSGEVVSSVEALSSGESELLGLGIDLMTACAIWDLDDKTNRVILLDEPDAHIHQDLQQHLASFLVKISEKYNVQIIIATHSTTLLSALGYFGGDKTSIVYMSKHGVRQQAIKFNDGLQELSLCLGGHLLMGPLFGAPLLLVEGDDDYKIWSHVPRFGTIKLAVLPCYGSDRVKQYQKTLEKLFDNLRSIKDGPVGFALLDGDKNLPIANPPHSTQDHVKFINLSCMESENLFLTDEVLKMIGTTWDAAIIELKKESHQLGKNKGRLDNCDSWNRKDVDIKDLINHICKILDPKNIPWTVTVARCIGISKPTGQLKEFLGVDVMNALWHEPI
jgi:energy-coupling factor transporter ATP-binding protein EcfA2